MMVRHVVAPVAELPPGSRKFLTIDERPIAVFNVRASRPAQPLPAPGRGVMRGAADRPCAIVRSRHDRVHATRRNHPLPLARLGVRYPHRPVLLRSPAVSGQGLSGQCRARHQRGEGALHRGDHRGLGGERLRGGGYVIVRPGVASSFETPRKCAAPQDEAFLDPHGEERGNAARLEPRGPRCAVTIRPMERFRPSAPASAARAHGAPARRCDRCRARTCRRAW